MSKDIGVVIAMPAELKQRFDAVAALAGISTPTLLLALALQGLKGQPSQPNAHVPAAEGQRVVEYGNPPQMRVHFPDDDDDAWRGPPPDDDPEPTSDVDVDAMIASRVAEAENAGLAQPPGQAYEAFGPPTAQVAPANVRALRRPPPQFAPANQASHLRSL